MTFSGSYVALVTPFKNNKVNEEKLAELIEKQIEEGSAGIVPCGTTGESPTLSWEEHNRVIALTVEIVNKRVQVLAGTGSNNTAEAIKATQHARDVGADAALVVNPYYNKPTQEGLYQHYKAIAERGGLPVVIYNIMGRTAVNITPGTLQRLAEVKNIVAIKEASADLNQMAEMIMLTGTNLAFLSGDDNLTLPLLAIGGQGVISVIANICPRESANLVKYFLAGDLTKSKELHYKLFPLCQSMFIETNPIPIKEAMNMLGMDVGGCRLPLTPLAETNREKLRMALVAYGFKV